MVFPQGGKGGQGVGRGNRASCYHHTPDRRLHQLPACVQVLLYVLESRQVDAGAEGYENANSGCCHDEVSSPGAVHLVNACIACHMYFFDELWLHDECVWCFEGGVQLHTHALGCMVSVWLIYVFFWVVIMY